MNYVIIGNGPAGTFAAKEIRQRDASSPITIISHDKHPFYSRPRLPEIISGKSAIEQLYIFPKQWYYNKDIDLILETTVKEIKHTERKILLNDGKSIKYDRLLIATGSLPRRIPVIGADGNNIHTLSTAEDALTLHNLARHSKEAVVIGAGFVGIEAAASIAQLGVRVTVIEVCDRLLPRQLDAEGSETIRPRLESLGITFLLNSVVEQIKDDGGRKTVVTKDGKVAQGDFVLIAAGIVSSISLAKDSGIAINRSIIVNERMETNIEGIYAAGDVAEHNGVCYGIWPVSKEQGEIAGRNMASETAIYNGSVLMTFLKIAGIDLASIGDITCDPNLKPQTVSKTDLSKSIYRKAFSKNGNLIGAILIGDTKPALHLKQAIGREFSTISDYWETI